MIGRSHSQGDAGAGGRARGAERKEHGAKGIAQGAKSMARGLESVTCYQIVDHA